MPFGGGISQEQATIVARAGAMVQACEAGAAVLLEEPLAYFAARSHERRVVFASAMLEMEECGLLADTQALPPTVRVTLCSRFSTVSDVPEKSSDPANAETSGSLANRIKSILELPDLVDFYALVAERRQEIVVEALRLAKDAGAALAQHGVEAEVPQSSRIQHLARSLEALDLFVQCLPFFNGTWAEPALVIRNMEQATRLADAMPMPMPMPMLWLALGEALLQSGRSQAALGALNRAVSLSPEWARARHSRGLVYLNLNNASLAEQDFNSALRLNAENPEYWQSRGVLRLLLGEESSMCDDFRRACGLGRCAALESARTSGMCSE